MNNVVVLLAAYNGMEWIDEQINSILNQRDVNVKIYISVDVSTDDTYYLLKNKYSLFGKVVLLPYGEKFGAAAPNFYHLFQEVDVANYDFIALSDQDDIWLDDKIISGIKKINQTDSAGYSSNVIAFWSNGKKRLIKKATKQRKYDYLFEGPGPGCSFILTRKFAMEVKQYFADEKEMLYKIDWHDWAIYAFARSKKYSWYIDPQSHMFYRQHFANQLGANSGIKQFLKRAKEIACGYAINQTLLIIKFLKFENNHFVKSWINCTRLDFVKLSFFAYECRRRKKDQLLFFLSCIIMAMIRPIKENK